MWKRLQSPMHCNDHSLWQLCCNYQVSSEKGRRKMGFLTKLKFWKKRNNKTPTKVDTAMSTEDPGTCDASAVTVDPTKSGCTFVHRESKDL